jgi:hypothetical protein
MHAWQSLIFITIVKLQALLDCVRKYSLNRVFLKFKILFMFLDYFDVLVSKIIYKNKKYYFDVFLSEKHFEV